MNNFNEIIKKRHLSNKDRCPRTYKEVEKILRTVKNCEANAKTVLHNSKLPRSIFKKVYALTFSVLKENRILNAVIEEVSLLKNEPYFRKELAEILLHELIFGKGLPPGESKPVQIIRKYQVEIEKAYNHLVKKGISAHNDIYSIPTIPKYVRINTLVTTISEVLEDLEYLGVEQVLFDDSISESEYLELVKNLKRNTFLIDKHFKNLLVFQSDENIANWSLYQKGHVHIQDKSSYIPPYVLNPEPGSIVLDACAAPGMKTLHLASIMENKGTLYAFEKDKNRFRTLNNMLQSGHTDIYQTFCEDFNLVDINDEKFSSVEYILLDPSCSGSGMVNRMDSVTDTEESKNEERIQKLAGFQIILLKHALLFPAVKRVVYSTCSVTEQENEYVVHEALNCFGNKFKLTYILPNWPIRGSKEYEFGSHCLRAYPDICLTNGFFVAMFERIDNFNEDKFSSKKRSRKVKKDIFIEEKSIPFEKETQRTKKQKFVRNCQNDWDSYGNFLEENNFNNTEGNIGYSKKDTIQLSNKKQKELFAEDAEIEGSVVTDSLRLENDNEKNSTAEKVSELHSKKCKKKHRRKNDIQEKCAKYSEIQKKETLNLNSIIQDEIHNIDTLTQYHKKCKKTKHTPETDAEKYSSSESVIKLHFKKHKNNCDEFIGTQKEDAHNLINPTNNNEQNELEVYSKHKKSKHSKKHKRDREHSDSIGKLN